MGSTNFLRYLDDEELLPSRPGSFILRGINCGASCNKHDTSQKTISYFLQQIKQLYDRVGIYGAAATTLSKYRLLSSSLLNFRYRSLF
jgi:hypothetical protein